MSVDGSLSQDTDEECLSLFQPPALLQNMPNCDYLLCRLASHDESRLSPPPTSPRLPVSPFSKAYLQAHCQVNGLTVQSPCPQKGVVGDRRPSIAP
jgi:hypothetical protein